MSPGPYPGGRLKGVAGGSPGPYPGGEVEGSGQGGLQTQGRGSGVVVRGGWVCIPACTEADNPQQTVTAADGTHPTGMHFCFHITRLLNRKQNFSLIFAINIVSNVAKNVEKRFQTYQFAMLFSRSISVNELLKLFLFTLSEGLRETQFPFDAFIN